MANRRGGEHTEWAVVRRGFGGQVDVVLKGGLGSREEAEAWRRALNLTEDRTAHEDFLLATGGIRICNVPQVASRVIGAWQYETVDAAKA